MNYEDKYKQALERARYYHSKDYMLINNAIENIFPELAKSEDEKIRKEIIAFLRSKNGYMTPNEDWDFHNRWLAWLEKQKPNTNKREVDAAYLRGICDAKQEIEKRSEQAITDKVEPKVRDWVILNSTVAQILDKQKYGFVGLDTDGKDFFCNYGHTDSIRLWSIADAKEGDILATDESVFIYAKVIYNKPYAYCGVDKFGVFKDNCLENNWSNSLDNIYPASKEQRDLLFQKIKEAGYKWDAVKKELKKVEVTSKEDEDEKIRKSIIAILDNYIDDDNTIKPVIMNWLEKQGKALNPDKVIKWLNDQACLGWIEDVEVDKFIRRFKKDFKL